MNAVVISGDHVQIVSQRSAYSFWDNNTTAPHGAAPLTFAAF
jgi:hypothetical protein